MAKNLIILVGFMGSGKSTLGKKLAKLMGRPFYDLDQMLESNLGMSISDYFSKFGEDAFRVKEREILKEIPDLGDCILSTGGGTPCFFDNMEVLNQAGLTIYLQLSVNAIFSRLHAENVAKRPVLKGLSEDSLLAFISDKLREREPYYSQAKIIIQQLRTPVKDVKELIENYYKKNNLHT